MSRTTMSTGLVSFLLCASLVVAGCAGGEHADHSAPAGTEPHAAEHVADVEVSPEAAAVLARADLADGVEDHVVSKCPGCSLAMDGSAEHVAQVGEYELHFCSDRCSNNFQRDTEASILALADDVP